MKEKKYYDDIEFNRILLLIKNKKFDRALTALKDYLAIYPYDACACTSYTTLLINYGDLDEASKIVDNFVVTNRTNDRSLIEFTKIRIRLLCCQRKYEECYSFFLENSDLLKDNIEDYYSILAFLRKNLNLPIDIDDKYHSYTVRQVISYSEEEAINHIQKHMNNFDEKNISCFVSDFPLEEMYYKIRGMLPIKKEKERYSGTFKNLDIFKYDYNGRYFRKSVDYIKVVSIQDTNDIITMFPCENNENLPYIDLNYTDKNEDLSKVKRMSQIDKFNQRYNR